MNQFTEFFRNLFDTSDWPPRWICGTWSEFHGWLYITSDVVIWLAYFIIPVIIIWFVQKRPDVPFLPVFWLFGAFILFCGATHIIDAIIFWWPGYRLSALVRFFTAIISFVTVFALIRDLPKALDLRLPKDEDEVLNNLRSILNAQEEEIRSLRTEITRFKSNS